MNISDLSHRSFFFDTMVTMGEGRLNEWTHHSKSIKKVQLKICNPAKIVPVIVLVPPSCTMLKGSKQHQKNPLLSETMKQNFDRYPPSRSRMEANAEEISALTQWGSTKERSPRDTPSEMLEGLGTLAYHMYAEQLISI